MIKTKFNTMETLIYLILIGLAAGFLGGMVGIGGGVIIVPALVLLFGLSQHNAQGISLAMMLFPVGLFGVLNYYSCWFFDRQLSRK